MFGTFSDSFRAGRRIGVTLSTPNITALQVWYDATDPAQFKPSNPSSGSSIQQWLDKSAFAHNAKPSGTGPVYATNIQGSLDALLFDGAASNLYVSPVSWMQSLPGFSLFLVAKATSLTGTRPITSTDVDGFKIFYSGSWGVKTSGGEGMSGNTGNTSSFHIFGLIFDGTQSTNAGRLRFRYDRTEQSLTFSGSVGTLTSAAATQFNMGYYSTNFFKGYIGEIVMFSRALLPYEVTNIENYLTTHWGL